MDGVELIAAERRRQIADEGYTATHDEGHVNGELAEAAACYVNPEFSADPRMRAPVKWPWAMSWWKPSLDYRNKYVRASILPAHAQKIIRDLAKAGALIAAEIDRLQRKSGLDVKAGHAVPEDPMIEVIFLGEIEEWREVFVCECGRKAYCLDPGDGLPTHISDGAITKMVTRAEAALL